MKNNQIFLHKKIICVFPPSYYLPFDTLVRIGEIFLAKSYHKDILHVNLDLGTIRHLRNCLVIVWPMRI